MSSRPASAAGSQAAGSSAAARTCDECGTASAKLLWCGRCSRVRYCSPECQKLAWKARHKAECCPDVPRARLSSIRPFEPLPDTAPPRVDPARPLAPWIQQLLAELMQPSSEAAWSTAVAGLEAAASRAVAEQALLSGSPPYGPLFGALLARASSAQIGSETGLAAMRCLAALCAELHPAQVAERLQRRAGISGTGSGDALVALTAVLGRALMSGDARAEPAAQMITLAADGCPAALGTIAERMVGAPVLHLLLRRWMAEPLTFDGGLGLLISLSTCVQADVPAALFSEPGFVSAAVGLLSAPGSAEPHPGGDQPLCSSLLMLIANLTLHPLTSAADIDEHLQPALKPCLKLWKTHVGKKSTVGITAARALSMLAARRPSWVKKMEPAIGPAVTALRLNPTLSPALFPWAAAAVELLRKLVQHAGLREAIFATGALSDLVAAVGSPHEATSREALMIMGNLYAYAELEAALAQADAAGAVLRRLKAIVQGQAPMVLANYVFAALVNMCATTPSIAAALVRMPAALRLLTAAANAILAAPAASGVAASPARLLQVLADRPALYPALAANETECGLLRTLVRQFGADRVAQTGPNVHIGIGLLVEHHVGSVRAHLLAEPPALARLVTMAVGRAAGPTGTESAAGVPQEIRLAVGPAAVAAGVLSILRGESAAAATTIERLMRETPALRPLLAASGPAPLRDLRDAFAE